MSDSTPTLVLTGGQVLTMDDDFAVAEGVAVRGRTVVAVGGDAEIRALAGPGTRVVDLGGRTVLPGINDSHLHGAAYGMTKPPFALAVGHPAVASIADIVAVVGREARTARPGEWIVGLGWDPGYLAECLADSRRFPHRRDLDAVAPDTPVCLTDFSSHMVWVNTAALCACGIDASSVPPPGGVIDLDADGEPTGILREAAQGLLQGRLPSPTVAQRRQAIRNVITELHARGINMNPAIKRAVSDLMDEVVGAERSAYQWPVRSAVEAGIAVCASSDAPITEPDWRQGVAAMMLRESRASGRPSGPEQCVGLADALRAYTVNAARQDFAEAWKGSVEAGKVADLCVLGRPLLGLDPHGITDVEVDLTVFDGRVVHER